MIEIDLDKKYELFLETLRQCGAFLWQASDEEIAYFIFEEFDGNSISFLSAEMLKTLAAARLIDEEISHRCLLLAQKFRALEGTALWNVEAVKHSKEWAEILTLSDRIKALIAEKNG